MTLLSDLVESSSSPCHPEQDANFGRRGKPASQIFEDQDPLLESTRDPLIHDGNTSAVDDNWPKSSIITTKMRLLTDAFLMVLYLLFLLVAFQRFVFFGVTIASVLLTLFAGFISMRAFGETDNGVGLAIGASSFPRPLLKCDLEELVISYKGSHSSLLGNHLSIKHQACFCEHSPRVCS